MIPFNVGIVRWHLEFSRKSIALLQFRIAQIILNLHTVDSFQLRQAGACGRNVWRLWLRRTLFEGRPSSTIGDIGQSSYSLLLSNSRLARFVGNSVSSSSSNRDQMRACRSQQLHSHSLKSLVGMALQHWKSDGSWQVIAELQMRGSPDALTIAQRLARSRNPRKRALGLYMASQLRRREKGVRFGSIEYALDVTQKNACSWIA